MRRRHSAHQRGREAGRLRSWAVGALAATLLLSCSPGVVAAPGSAGASGCGDGGGRALLLRNVSDAVVGMQHVAALVDGERAGLEELFHAAAACGDGGAMTEEEQDQPPGRMSLSVVADRPPLFVGNSTPGASVFLAKGFNRTVLLVCARPDGLPCILEPTAAARALGLRFLHADNGARVETRGLVLQGWRAPGGAGILVTNKAHAILDKTVLQGCQATGGAMGGGVLVVNATAEARGGSAFRSCSTEDAALFKVVDPSGRQDAGEDRFEAHEDPLEDPFFDVMLQSGVRGPGGGLAVVGEGSSFVAGKDTVWDSNSAEGGGAIFFAGGQAVLRESTVRDNLASRAGGGLLAVLGARVVSLECLFLNNFATSGGNVMLSRGADFQAHRTELARNPNDVQIARNGGNLAIYSSTAKIMDNSLIDHGRALLGAGAYLASNATLALVGTALSNNIAAGLSQDGSPMGSGGAVYITNSSTLETSGVTFHSNMAYVGAHVSMASGSRLVSATSRYTSGYLLDFWNVYYAEDGGALCVLGGSTVWSSSDLFQGDSADKSHAVFSSGSSLAFDNATFEATDVGTYYSGAAFRIRDGSFLSMTSSTIKNNKGGTIPEYSVGIVDRSSLWMENVTIENNARPRYHNKLVTPAVALVNSSYAAVISADMDQGVSCGTHDCLVHVSGDGPVAMLLEEEDRAPEPPIACDFLEKPDAQNGTTVCQLPSDLDSFPAGAISPEEIQPEQCQEELKTRRWQYTTAQEAKRSPGNCTASRFMEFQRCGGGPGSRCPTANSEEVPLTDSGTLAPSMRLSRRPAIIGTVVGLVAGIGIAIGLAAPKILQRRSQKQAGSSQRGSKGAAGVAAAGLHTNSCVVIPPSAYNTRGSIQSSLKMGTSDGSRAISSAVGSQAADALVNFTGHGSASSASVTPDIDLDIDFASEVQPYLSRHRRIGSGGFGDVYKMQIRGRMAAVKVFSRGYTGASDDQYQSFIKELELMGRFQACEQIVKIYGASVVRPHVAIAYELVEGGSLAERIRAAQAGGPSLTYREVLKAGYDIARGLEYLHPAVVHRDLKPGNVLIAANGTCKLIDFGESRLKDPFDTHLSTTPGGTPNYMAPEQLAGGQMDEKADVYALGVILWEAATGRQIWPDLANYAQFYYKVAVQEERPEIPEHLPKRLQHLIAKCWRQDPLRRPSAPEIVKYLKIMIKEEAEPGPRGGDAADPDRPLLPPEQAGDVSVSAPGAEADTSSVIVELGSAGAGGGT